MKFLIVDAFAENIFGGNPAGVVILPDGADYPADEVMVKTAAELRYSESAFVKQLGPQDFQVRYFTPVTEVDLCGHATIGTFCALAHLGIIEDGSRVTAHTLAGDLAIEVKGADVMMEMASPELVSVMENAAAVKELHRVMGMPETAGIAVPAETGDLLPAIVSTGLPDIIMPVATQADLAALAPDMQALSELSERYGVTGVHVFTLDTADDGDAAVSNDAAGENAAASNNAAGGDAAAGDNAAAGNNAAGGDAAAGNNAAGGKVTAHARNFAPVCGIDEEAATGTASGAMTYYLYRNGVLSDTEDCLYIQGEAMGRPSAIRAELRADSAEKAACGDCRIREGGDCKIRVGGSAAILAEGEIHL